MESATTASWDQNSLVDVLTQGEELAKQLGAHLEPSPSEFCKSLAQKIRTTFSTAISMAKSACPNNAGSDSPRSASESPRSENSDRPFNDHERRESKKRKALPKWTRQVRVCSGAGIEGPPDDGYGWRKYGQKDILGAKYPRGYYRCTHRNAQGCVAKKQVQRADEDPSVFDITYQGSHTCLQVPRPVPMLQGHQEPPTNQDNHSFGSGLEVKTEGFVSDPASTSFSFPSTPVAFSSALTLDPHFMGNFSPTFASTATSGSAYFSMSPCRMSSCPGGANPHAGESELHDVVSAATSAMNSPIMDIDFVLSLGELDADFPFDASNFFS